MRIPPEEDTLFEYAADTGASSDIRIEIAEEPQEKWCYFLFFPYQC